MIEPIELPGRRAFLGMAGSALAGGILHAGAKPEPVSVAVIGTGARGSDLLRALTTIDGVQVAGICDDYAPHLAQGAKYAGPKARTFTDHKEMLDKLKPRAVVIAVPLALHYRIASDALEAGCDVFLEKTMCYTIDEAQRLARRVAETKRVFQVGLQRRANPIYVQAAAMVESGMIGSITAIKAQWHRHNNWRRPVPVPKTDPQWQALERRLNWRLYKATSAGLMAELGSHQMDVANWLLGTVPRRVHASGGIDYWRDGRDVSDNIFCIYDYEVTPTPADKQKQPGRKDSYTVRVTYSSLCNNAYEGATELILGTKGSLYLTSSKGLLFVEPGQDKIDWAKGSKENKEAETQAAIVTAGKTLKLANDPWAYRGKPTEIEIESGDDTRDELVSFVDHVRRQDVKTLVDARAGLLNAATVLIANQAVETGKYVEFPRELI